VRSTNSHIFSACTPCYRRASKATKQHNTKQQQQRNQRKSTYEESKDECRQATTNESFPCLLGRELDERCATPEETKNVRHHIVTDDEESREHKPTHQNKQRKKQNKIKYKSMKTLYALASIQQQTTQKSEGKTAQRTSKIKQLWDCFIYFENKTNQNQPWTDKANKDSVGCEISNSTKHKRCRIMGHVESEKKNELFDCHTFFHRLRTMTKFNETQQRPPNERNEHMKRTRSVPPRGYT
jgi:hypothetical protein